MNSGLVVKKQETEMDEMSLEEIIKDPLKRVKQN